MKEKMGSKDIIDMKKRSISSSFLGQLKTGNLKSITDYVRVDPYLDLELRGDSVMIYYRGGKVLTVDEKGLLTGLADEYYLSPDTERIQPTIEGLHDYLAHAKHIVDIHEANPEYSKLGEKEIQQRVVYENNLSVNADNTDYFIADVEWADNKVLKGRADIVAFRWNHMEHRKRVIQLTLIEVKQGEDAIRTNGKNSPGLKKHYDDYLSFKEDQEYVDCLAKDMLLVLKQKKELGLVKGLDNLFEKKITETDASGNIVERRVEMDLQIEAEPDFLFLLANYHHYSTNLQIECEDKDWIDDCKFINASFCGYGLYKDMIKTKKELKFSSI
ncbi:hypothetical protein QUW02_05450 [Bacteroides eggerthii]|uniref:Uncharacterized protein n=1 Tax=Bacteroides eggerthii TaxID=28111 RepID=A0ABT7U4C8_9BACE|nr:hypothetical protein [Bacteroides eggerthii]